MDTPCYPPCTVEFEDEETQIAPAGRTMVTPTIELLRPLGRGGMGHVWVARHHGLRTDVVVKFMAEHLADDPAASTRFSREAAAASQVKSPHVVQMFDHGVAQDGRLYIAMELLEGMDLATVLGQRRRLEAAEVVTIVSQVARALAKAHERGIVHRDIKPENIFLLDAGGGELFVKVLDFGIAKSTFSTVGRGTATGAMIGTPLYMAPEQIMGARALGPAADLWSLGVVVFEMLTGTQPFNGETVGAISVAICSGELPRPTARNPALPTATDAWFQRACARDETQRFGSAIELAEALRASLANAPAGHPIVASSESARPRRVSTTGGVSGSRPEPSRSRPKWWAIGAVAVICFVGGLVGVAVFALSRPTASSDAQESDPRRATASNLIPPASTGVTASTEAVDSTPPPSSVEPAQTIPKASPPAKPKAPIASALPATTASAAPTPTTKKKKNVVIE